MTAEERKRRLEIFRQGMNGEFWGLMKEELKRISDSEGKLALKYLQEGKHEKGVYQDGLREGLERAIKVPETVVNYNDSIFKRIQYSICERCGQAIKRLKEKINAT